MFSASASFGASVVLTTLGVVALTKVNEPKQVPFAIIPLVFAVQQVSEGMPMAILNRVITRGLL